MRGRKGKGKGESGEKGQDVKGSDKQKTEVVVISWTTLGF